MFNQNWKFVLKFFFFENKILRNKLKKTFGKKIILILTP